MTQGFDCATKLNGSTAVTLKAAGFEYVARYLPTSDWKGLTVAEVSAIQAAGLKLISIFEKGATKASYFTKSQGISDAKEAYKLAKALGQPVGSTIYFTVDYDAQPTHMGAIKEYLAGIRQCLVDYKIGLYGSHDVMQAVNGLVDYYWQTYAWSHGKVASQIHMHQYKNGVTVAGVQLDKDEIRQTPGAWDESYQSAPVNSGPVAKVIVLVDDLNIRKGPGTNYPVNRKAVKGEIFDVYANVTDWHNVGGDNWVFGNNGRYLSLDLNALKPRIAYPGYVFEVKKPLIKNDYVGMIQEKVNQYFGKTVVKVDDYYGEKTAGWVKEYQKAHGLKADGIVGPATWSVMF